jgi:hypothetical protein
MRCAKAREYLSHQLDDQLTPDCAGDLDAHLDDCPDCRAYQTDLAIGQRLLAATEPELPANFDWKLQLKLNQTLQQTAGEVAYPWQDENPDRWRWFRNFGAAAAVGMAAVLALAVFLGPMNESGTGALDGAVRVADSTPASTSSDRLPLTVNNRNSGGLYTQGLMRNVSSGGQRFSSPNLGNGWTRSSIQDGRTIQLLRKQNNQLQQRLRYYDVEMRRLRAKLAELDTTEIQPLDTQDNH